MKWHEFWCAYPNSHEVRMQDFNVSSDTWPEEKNLFEKCVRSETIPGSNITLFKTSNPLCLNAPSSYMHNACAVKPPRLVTDTSLGEEITKTHFRWGTFHTSLFHTCPLQQMLFHKQQIRAQNFNCNWFRMERILWWKI